MRSFAGGVCPKEALPPAQPEAGLALALVLMLFQRSGRLDIAFWQTLRESNQPKYVDLELPDEETEKKTWPKLTPAGREPVIGDEEQTERVHRLNV